jgi:outer membrane immunogenic protein
VPPSQKLGAPVKLKNHAVEALPDKGVFMKRFLLVGASLFAIAVAGEANAADLYPKPAVPYDWTGLYVGFEFGVGWGTAEQTDPTGFSSGPYTPNGAFVGGTLGYNWQMYNNWVLGLEGDASWADIGASTPGTDPSAVSHLGLGSTTTFGCGGLDQICQAKLESLETFRGRIGYAFGYVMPYATAGLAVGTLHGQEGDVPVNGAYGSGSSTLVGWTAGLGFEASILPRWTVKLEGLYTDLGKHTVFDDTIDGVTVPQSIHFTPAIIKIGVNYKVW